MMALADEAGWKNTTPRLQRAKVRRWIEERSAFFLEVRDRMPPGPHGNEDSEEEVHEVKNGSGAPSHSISYCTHCGGCCEIASGLPEFPEDTLMPLRWQEIFGKGLGRGHRFCPFLWQEKNSGGSLCSIHPWRSHPCRIFEREECEFLRNDPDFKQLSDPERLDQTYRLLLRLIDAG